MMIGCTRSTALRELVESQLIGPPGLSMVKR